MNIDHNNQSFMPPAGASRLGRCSGSGAAAPLLESRAKATEKEKHEERAAAINADLKQRQETVDCFAAYREKLRRQKNKS